MAIFAASIQLPLFSAPVSQSPRQMAAQGNADALDQSGSPSWRSIMENPIVENG